MRLKNRDFETFNDGVLTVCEASGRSLVKTIREDIRFGSRTVGVKRFWEAKIAGSEIAYLVAVPEQPGIDRGNIIIYMTGSTEFLRYKRSLIHVPLVCTCPWKAYSLRSGMKGKRDGKKNSSVRTLSGHILCFERVFRLCYC